MSFNPQEYLRDWYNDFTNGKGTSGQILIELQTDLYDSYHDTIQTLNRFSEKTDFESRPYVLFKDAKVYRVPISGWGARFSLLYQKDYTYEPKL